MTDIHYYISTLTEELFCEVLSRERFNRVQDKFTGYLSLGTVHCGASWKDTPSSVLGHVPSYCGWCGTLPGGYEKCFQQPSADAQVHNM
jgi:hypothetical protein